MTFALLVAAIAMLAAGACANDAVESRSAVADDPETLKAGATLFYECIACHATGKNEGHMQGPKLWGIFGSTAGKQAGFPYSDALTNTDIVWNEETLDHWLEKPSEFIPGNVMAYIGLSNRKDRIALIAYLRSVTTEQ